MAHPGRIDLTEEQWDRLKGMARSRTSPARSVLRAKIVLRRASGMSFRDIGLALGCDYRTAWECIERWKEMGLEGIEKDRSGRGRKSWVIREKGPEVIRKTTQEQPLNATQWSRSAMAKATGVSESTVGRIWKANGLKPHLAHGADARK